MKVVSIGTPNLKDVPESLTMLASRLKDGQEHPADHAIVVLTDPDGGVRVYEYGAVGSIAHEVGVLHMATLQLSLDSAEAIPVA